jgi:hypothetical protein
MQEFYMKDLASHYGPESCVCRSNAACEALTGESAGPVLSRERDEIREPTTLWQSEGNIRPKFDIKVVPNRNSPPAILLREGWREGGPKEPRAGKT